MKELQIEEFQTPIIWCDNNSGVSWVVNPVNHGRTKHNEIDIQFVRDKVKANTLEVRHVPSRDQIADIMTKPLGGDNFQRLKDKLNVTSSHLRMRENDELQNIHQNKNNNYEACISCIFMPAMHQLACVVL